MPRRFLLTVACLVAASPVHARPRAELPILPATPLSTEASGSALESLCLPTDLMLSFGGTAWAADSMRWEALPDSVWTFDTGVGSHFQHQGVCKDTTLHASMEGWTGLDLSLGTSGRFRRMGVADFAGAPSTCVGAAGGLSGNYSLWSGLTQSEAELACYVGGQGYGTSWDISMVKTFAYDGNDTLRMGFDYRVDSESGFDFAYVIVDTSCVGDESGEIVLGTYDGTGSGTGIFILRRGVHLPSQAGCFTVRFRFTSDGSYDDEDGLWSTSCGGFAVDNVRVTTIPYGGSLYDFSDFESGDDGWVETAPTCGAGGDFARLASLDDLDPLPPGECGVSDSVLVFFDPALNGHDRLLDNVAVSPWIDLKAAGAVGWGRKAIAFDSRAFLPFSTNGALIQIHAQHYPDTCDVSGAVRVSEFVSNGFLYETQTDTCISYVIDFSPQIPSYAEQVRIAIGVVNNCEAQWTGCSNATTNNTPYIDNVRLLVSDFTTIQAAVDAAAPGDTVYVPPGIYQGTGNHSIDFGGKNLVLLAPCGPALTRIQVPSTMRGFLFQSGEDSSAVVSGFDIIQGALSPGGGAWIRNGSHPTFENCLFRQCRADTGGAVAVEHDSSVRLLSCTFQVNGFAASPPEVGGAVHIATDHASPVPSRIADCVFDFNRADAGGAVYAAWAEIDRCTFIDNEATAGGALVAVSGIERCVIRDCVFESNQAAEDGGGLLSFGAEVYDCTFTGNTALRGGGAALQSGAVFDAEFGSIFVRCAVTGNFAHHGGGLSLGPLGTVEDCVVQANTAEFYGGGVSGGGCDTAVPSKPGASRIPDPCPGPPTVRGTLITGNVAGTYGGGVALVEGLNALLLESCTVTANYATAGGGFHVPQAFGGVSYISATNTIARDNGVISGDPLVRFGDADGVLDFVCAAVDSTEFTGPGTIQLRGPQVFDDPQLCAPEPYQASPTTAGNYKLTASSPCLPAFNPCGVLIGALGSGCSTLEVPGGEMPRPLALHAAPNPFTGWVRFTISAPAAAAPVRVRIYDLAGRLVRELDLSGGAAEARWDGRGAGGDPVAPGIYFARAAAGDWSTAARIVKLR